MGILLRTIHIIGLVILLIPMVSALEVAVKNIKKKDYLGAIVQAIMLICVMYAYIVSFATLKGISVYG